MDFFAKKIATLFTRFDMDKNGKIEEDDFATWSSKLVSIGILNAAQSEHLRNCMKSIWTSYFLPADTDNDGSVTVEELIVHMRSVRYSFKLNKLSSISKTRQSWMHISLVKSNTIIIPNT